MMDQINLAFCLKDCIKDKTMITKLKKKKDTKRKIIPMPKTEPRSKCLKNLNSKITKK